MWLWNYVSHVKWKIQNEDFENRVITNIFGSKTEELTRERTEIRNDGIHNQILFERSDRGR